MDGPNEERNTMCVCVCLLCVVNIYNCQTWNTRLRGVSFLFNYQKMYHLMCFCLSSDVFNKLAVRFLCFMISSVAELFPPFLFPFTALFSRSHSLCSSSGSACGPTWSWSLPASSCSSCSWRAACWRSAATRSATRSRSLLKTLKGGVKYLHIHPTMSACVMCRVALLKRWFLNKKNILNDDYFKCQMLMCFRTFPPFISVNLLVFASFLTLSSCLLSCDEAQNKKWAAPIQGDKFYSNLHKSEVSIWRRTKRDNRKYELYNTISSLKDELKTVQVPP